jgi:tetratricopeptide (TPR) repeat protein
VFFLNKPAIHLVLILVIAIFSYSNTFNVPFQMDDGGNIVDNPAIKNLNNFIHMDKIDQDITMEASSKSLFKMRYIGYLSFALNYAVHGLDVWGYHCVNLLIHLCTTLLVYYLVFLTFKTSRFQSIANNQPSTFDSRNVIALFTALIFAVHPVQTQAVTYIVQRFASLATMLWMLSLVSYLLFRLSSADESGAVKRSSLYCLSLVSAILAMKTKEFSLLLPLIIAIYEYMFLDGSFKKRLRYLTPFCLSVAIIPLTLRHNGDNGLLETASKNAGSYGSISSFDYLFTQFRVIVTYLRLLLFPVHQKFDYDYPIFRSFFIPEVILSLLLLLSIVSMAVYFLYLSKDINRKDSYLYRIMAFGLFWFFITLSVESSFIPIADVIFEHRLYLPSIGFILTVISALELLRRKWGTQRAYIPEISVYAMLLLATGLSAATYSRNHVWRNQFSLLEDEIKKSPGKDRPRYLLGKMYGERGQMDKAEYHLRMATSINPGSIGSHYFLAITYMRMNRLAEAADEYKKAIALKFVFAEAHAGLGDIYTRQGRIQEALNEYRIALSLKPSLVEVHYNLGKLYAGLGMKNEARNEFSIALRLNPNFVEAREKLNN